MASVIQKTTISTVTASTRWPTSDSPSGGRHEADDQHGNDADEEADLLDFCFTH